jgi:hypothetical protein
MRGKVEERERGDNRCGGGSQIVGGMWPLGLQRMDLRGCRDAIVWSYLGLLASGLCDRHGAVTISPLGLHGRHDKTSRKQNWRPQECEWTRPRDSKSELADKDKKEEKRNKKWYYVSSLINCVRSRL